MCGIFGFAGFERPGLLRRMADVLQHRGPDGEGFFVHGRFSMGMRRLSIIDLEGGGQPIYNEDQSLAVCFNGEIYNYVELKRELEEKGHRFRTHSDTEVIVHAYEQWGEDCLERFNGMFAFALYDKGREELFIARDRAGQKPLYYLHENGRFLFGSEIKAILECDDVERRPNVGAIDGYLALRYVPQPDTLFEGIRVLPAGHRLRLRLRQNELRVARYWDVPLVDPRAKTGSDAEHLADFEELFLDAVRLTLRSDVPVGAYLSGGIDSSLVVAAMTRFSQKIETFSIGFRSPIDETHEAAALAKVLGTTHHEIHLLPEHFRDLPKVLWHLERPIGDALILAYYELARETSKHLKVVLSGEGADESYAGYSFHKIIQWTERYRRVVPRALHRGVAVPAVDALPVAWLDKLFVYPAYLGERGKAKTVDYLRHYHGRDLAQNYVTLKALWDQDERRQLYAPGLRAQTGEAWLHHARGEGGSFLDRLLKLQFDDWLQDNLLLRQDKNTMAHSLELRCPFLDHRVIEQAFRLPDRAKLRGLRDKWIERELGRKWLPPENVKRSKNPFYLPLEYFHEHSEIRELIRWTLDPERVAKRGWFDPGFVRWLVERMETGEFLYLKQVVSLVILELWYAIFIDRQRLW
jgi:asparagine synthase (glutamine-hydrolysing)